MTTEVDIVEVPASEEASYVDWPAIIAGIVLATAISILLLTFGSAVGLSFTNFDAREDASPIWIAIAAASWLLWVQVSSFMAGGYLTGRMRRRHGDATEDESDVRDGAHGLLVWAGALVVGAVLAMGGIGALANAVGSTAATLTNAAATAAGPAAGQVADDLDPNAYFVDLLFRPAPAGEAAGSSEAAATEEPAEAPATEAPATTTPGATADTPATGAAASPAAPAATAAAAPATTAAPSTSRDAELVRGEATRIFAQAATGEVDDADRTYLAQLVADQTALSDEAAAARVDDVTAAMATAREEAAQAAETARKTGIVGAFLIAASFLVSAIGAYWAAQKGGNHRDKGTVFPGVFRRF